MKPISIQRIHAPSYIFGAYDVQRSPATASSTTTDSDREHKQLRNQVKRTREVLLGEKPGDSFADILAEVSRAGSAGRH